MLDFHTRSDHQANDALYEVDHLLRFYHAQVHDERATSPENYLKWNALGEAIRSTARRLVLIDEIDKAPRDFPNDLLDEIDQMDSASPSFSEVPGRVRPIVIITSNSERQLPDPFLRRCVFHRIEFPAADRLQAILEQRLGHLKLSDLPQRSGREAIRRGPRPSRPREKAGDGRADRLGAGAQSTNVNVDAIERSALTDLPSPRGARENRARLPATPRSAG